MRMGHLAIVACIAIFMFSGAWLLWGRFGLVAAEWFLAGSEPAKAGAWGDSFGAFNALISSFGFAAVALTLWSQSQALEQQKIALDRQQEEIQRQNDSQHRQRFETTFFELLKLIRECKSEVRYSDMIGQRVFDAVAMQISHNLDDSNLDVALITIDKRYQNIHKNLEATLSPYFRVIYRILDNIRKDSVLTDGEKLSYARLFRGQLSSSELILIASNGRLVLAKDLPDLIAEHRLLKYLPEGPVREALKQFYPREAFLGHGD